MAKDIRLCLVYRDMWQSSGKYLPKVDQLVRVAESIIEMGCFARVETNGGGFEQINLLFGENPNKAVRQWTQPFNDVGIQTQMLERALNGIRMSPVPVDVRQLMFKVKKKQGTDIARSFDGLNDARNIIDSIRYAKAAGMIAQAALSITHSKVHTVDYYIRLGKTLIQNGADEICIKDMAGIGRPVSIGKIIKGIKADFPNTLIQYHGHSTPGFSVATSLEAARAGADIIDVSMEPLSWGTGHADLLTIHEMLKDAGFSVPDFDRKAYMKTRGLTQSFIDDFLGFYINPYNRKMNSLLIGPGLPGGMMGSLMADLEKNLNSINKWFGKNGMPIISQDDILMRMFEEVEYIWPKMGYPPLVTPYSQYVKNTALRNVMQMMKGKKRWSVVDDNTLDMLMGKSGKLPGEVAPELLELAKSKGKEIYTGLPQTLYPNQLDFYRQKMKEKGWDTGQDDEELMEYAMHPQQYEAYKSGAAKMNFEADLAKKRAAKNGTSTPPVIVSKNIPVTNFAPKTLNIAVNGEQFIVKVAYDETEETFSKKMPAPPATTTAEATSISQRSNEVANTNLLEIVAPLEGKFYFKKENSDVPVKMGDRVKEGDVIGHIESMKVYNAITADQSGKVVAILVQDGQEIDEDDVLMRLQG